MTLVTGMLINILLLAYYNAKLSSQASQCAYVIM